MCGLAALRGRYWPHGPPLGRSPLLLRRCCRGGSCGDQELLLCLSSYGSSNCSVFHTARFRSFEPFARVSLRFSFGGVPPYCPRVNPFYSWFYGERLPVNYSKQMGCLQNIASKRVSPGGVRG